MSGLMRWRGDELFLGATKMAEVMPVVVPGESGSGTVQYVLGPNDFISEPYESPDDCRQDCERHVRDLLKKAGAGDV